MRIRIVSYEFGQNWILTKFADKLSENLRAIGHNADVAESPDPDCDINHHIIYLGYDHRSANEHDGKDGSLHTLMITHVDAMEKVRLLKDQLQVAALGICMSSHTQGRLVNYGVPQKRLCYITPAHDALLTPPLISIGLLTRLYPDGRKNEKQVLELANRLSPKVFSFKIMGEGWGKIVEELRSIGFTVDHFDGFNEDGYVDILSSLDYYMYLGWDEGSMGFLDALAAGVKTIVTPQGFHLDIKDGIHCRAKDIDAVIEHLLAVQSRRETLAGQMALLTWRNYAEKHVAVWEHLLGVASGRQADYPDGVNSIGQGEKAGYSHYFLDLAPMLLRHTRYYMINELPRFLVRICYSTPRAFFISRLPGWLKTMLKKMMRRR